MSIKEKLFYKEKETNIDGMDPLMKAIKAVHSNFGTSDVERAESLDKQRASQELFSRLVTPDNNVRYEREQIYRQNLAFKSEHVEKHLLRRAGYQTEENVFYIPVEWARPVFPHRKDRIILYCHGGGYTCGGLGYAGILAGKMAMHTGLEVLSFEYRLAPENPYPAAIEDVVTIWDYLMYLGYGADDIIVAGDSAGGNLALELVLTLQAQNRKIPAALVLFSPWTDMTVTLPSYEKFKDVDPLLTKEYVLGVRRAYAGLDVADDIDNDIYKDPSFSPLYADLSGMPPTLIEVGSNEILRSDSEELYKKLKKKNIYSRLLVYNGGWHVFQQMPIPKANKALDDVREFIEAL